jgi:tetratricopeptide (TPR) repeat protein
MTSAGRGTGAGRHVGVGPGLLGALFAAVLQGLAIAPVIPGDVPAFVAPARAADGDGGLADPLAGGVGARERALGGGVASARGPSALGSNPAWLARSDRLTLHAHLSPLAEGGTYEHVGVALPWGPGVVGAGLTRLGTGDIVTYDAWSVETGAVGFSEGELGAAYGVEVASGLVVGALARYRWQSLGDARAQGLGLDLGLGLEPARWPGLGAGLALRGVVTPSLALGGEGDRLPRSLDLGVTYGARLGGLPWTWNGGATLGGGASTALVGAEAAIGSHLALRAGLHGDRPRLGFGLVAGALALDYVLDSRDLGLVHGISITAYLGRGASARLEALRADARAEGVATERAAREREVDGFADAARAHQAAGELDAARRQWLAYLAHRPGDAAATAALDAVRMQLAATRHDSVRTREAAAVRAGRLDAVRDALAAGELEAAAVLLDALPPEMAAEIATRTLEEKLATAREARRTALRREAAALEASGRLAEAVAVWSRLLLLDASDASARAGIERADEHLRRLERTRDDQSTELDRLSLLVKALEAYGAEEYVLAEGLVDSLLVLDPDARHANELKRRLARRRAPPAASVTEDARTLYIEGMRHFNAGRYAAAIDAWEQILDLDPDNDSVRRNIDEARARLGLEGRME